MQRAEEFALHFGNALRVEFKVVPRLGVGHHIPARGVGAVLAQGLERIDGIAEPFGHLVAVFIQHQAVRHHVFVGHRIEDHGGDGVQGKEPAARLVHALGNEIGRKTMRKLVFILKRIVQLGVGHGPAVEPYVDEVAFSLHGFARSRNQGDAVHVGAVQVEA